MACSAKREARAACCRSLLYAVCLLHRLYLYCIVYAGLRANQAPHRGKPGALLYICTSFRSQESQGGQKWPKPMYVWHLRHVQQNLYSNTTPLLYSPYHWCLPLLRSISGSRFEPRWLAQQKHPNRMQSIQSNRSMSPGTHSRETLVELTVLAPSRKTV
jgi:hypothetical protein